MDAMVLRVFSRRASKLVAEVLLTAAGEFMAQLCAESKRLNDKQQIATLRRQLAAASVAAGRWHMKAMDLQANIDAMLDIKNGPTIELELAAPERWN